SMSPPSWSCCDETPLAPNCPHGLGRGSRIPCISCLLYHSLRRVHSLHLTTEERMSRVLDEPHITPTALARLVRLDEPGRPVDAGTVIRWITRGVCVRGQVVKLEAFRLGAAGSPRGRRWTGSWPG